MTVSDTARMAALSAIWGASFLLIKLGVNAVPPVAVVEVRMGLGALAVILYALVTGHAKGLLRAMRRPSVYVVGMVNAAIPYLCFAWGEQRVPSGVAAIANAMAPVYGVVIAAAWPLATGREPLRRTRVAGVLVGFAGVAVLVGLGGIRGAIDLLGLVVVLIAPVMYAIGTLLARTYFARDSPLLPAATTNLGGALIFLLPALVFGRPTTTVPASAWLALLGLGVGGTGIAYILAYRLLTTIGSTRLLTVTYLLPVFALAYGHLLLGESVGRPAIVALVLILAGVFVAHRGDNRKTRRGDAMGLPPARG